MILSKENVGKIEAREGMELPQENLFNLPEKVLQFGTGVLLRGLPDYFIDKANKQGIFNGRVVIIKSTSTGGTDAFETQNGLFTLCVKGIEHGEKKDQTIVNASISRVFSAKDQWAEILACAANAEMQVVVSNTTEVGLTLVADDKITAAPPVSFPGKLLAFLYERYKIFNGAAESGMVIIPTELIPDNGKLLKSICLQLAENNGLDAAFKEWLVTANDFCSSLVDRIVPGKLPKEEHEATVAKNGYEDDLMIMTEVYRLWAIETANPSSKEILSFAKADEDGVVVTDNINKFRELKLRLLNGGHTLTCGLAVLSGFSTVKEAMADSFFESFLSDLLHQEIAKSIQGINGIEEKDTDNFIKNVLDRFRNPFIEHQWLSITVQYTSKLQMRCVPVLKAFYDRFNEVPKHVAIGFAAYIIFMNSDRNEQDQFVGKTRGKQYIINDDKAAYLNEKWRSGNLATVVHSVLADHQLWNADLTQFTGFEEAVLIAAKRLSTETGIAAQQQSLLEA